MHEGKEVCLQGDKKENEVTPITASQLQQMCRRQELAQCFVIQLTNVTEGNSLVNNTPNPRLLSLESLHKQPYYHPIPEVQELLTKYTDVFSEPTKLPPQRIFDH